MNRRSPASRGIFHLKGPGASLFGPQTGHEGASGILLFAMLIGMFAMAPGCAHTRSLGFRLVPQPGPSYTIEGGAAIVKNDDFRLTVIPLDDLARQAFIQSKTAGSPDPFRSGPAGVPRYITFRVFLDNLSDSEPVSFQPQSVYLASEMGDRLFPMDYPEAYTRLVGTASTDPRFLDDLRKYLFDVGVSVPPGGHAEGLLVYTPVGRTAHKLRMEFNFLQTGGTTNRNLDIFFRKEPAP